MTDDTLPATSHHDMSRHDATAPDKQYPLTPKHVVEILTLAGVPRDERTVQRWCERKVLDVIQDDVGGYFITKASVDNKIIELRQLFDLQQRRRATTLGTLSGDVATRHDVSREETPSSSIPTDSDITRHVTTTPDTQSADDNASPETTAPDASRRDTTQHDMSSLVANAEKGTQDRTTLPPARSSDLDIFEHPYVKKLEAHIETLEERNLAQVRRTEEIQLKAQQGLLELHRMTSIGQSKTLADFMLQAKDWLLAAPTDTQTAGESRSDHQAAA